jgi:hypothetical protein
MFGLAPIFLGDSMLFKNFLGLILPTFSPWGSTQASMEASTQFRWHASALRMILPPLPPQPEQGGGVLPGLEHHYGNDNDNQQGVFSFGRLNLQVQPQLATFTPMPRFIPSPERWECQRAEYGGEGQGGGEGQDEERGGATTKTYYVYFREHTDIPGRTNFWKNSSLMFNNSNNVINSTNINDPNRTKFGTCVSRSSYEAALAGGPGQDCTMSMTRQGHMFGMDTGVSNFEIYTENGNRGPDEEPDQEPNQEPSRQVSSRYIDCRRKFTA